MRLQANLIQKLYDFESSAQIVKRMGKPTHGMIFAQVVLSPWKH